MELVLCACIVGVALFFGVSVLAFQNPVRAVFGLVLAGGATASALAIVCGATVAGPVIWLGSTTGGLLLYLVLLLNLTKEELGARRLSVRRFGALLVAAFALSGIGAAIYEVTPPLAAREITASALATALVGPLGPLFVLVVAALGLAVMTALTIARRRP